MVVRGYNVMRGYFDDPSETAVTIDAAGWLHTGDIGIMDDRGYLRITDRTKDMFIVGGFNAYPAEIENLMLRNDAVAQAAVIGMPDARMGEVAMAFVVPRPGASIVPAEPRRVVSRDDGQLQGPPGRRDRRRPPPERDRQGAEVPASRTCGRANGRRRVTIDDRDRHLTPA